MRWLSLLPLVLLAACQDSLSTRMPELALKANRQSEIIPGPRGPSSLETTAYEGNEEHIAEGKVLYGQFNCAGCHAGGGGAIGPALMDDVWIYGGSVSNIYWTVVEGRPNGMPAFGSRIPAEKLWRLSAYVKSLESAAAEAGK